MTEQKKLKQFVRARMSRNGESYATAHRHVTSGAAGAASAPPLAPGDASGDGDDHRATGWTRRLLGAAGLELSAPMVCGLGGGIGFLYAVFEYRGMAHPLLTVVAQHHPQPWLEVTADHLGVATQTLHSTSAAAALRKLDSVLAEGRPALVSLARGQLDWLPARGAEESAEPYPLVVAGAGDGVYLLDDLDEGRHEVGREQLGTAWAAHRKGRFELTTVAAVPASVDLVSAARRAMALTASHLTGPVLNHAYDVNFGLSGMRKLADELLATGRTGWTARFGEPAAFAYAMTRLAECLTSAHTAPGATRPLYRRFLMEAADLMGSDAARQAAAAIGTSAGHWERAAELASGATAALQADHAATFTAIAAEVRAAAAAEESAVPLLLAASG